MKQNCHINERRRRGSFSTVLCRKICKEGLQKRWIKYGTEDHTRYLPIYFTHEQLGTSFSSSLLQAHILTEYGTKIKVVPKKVQEK